MASSMLNLGIPARNLMRRFLYFIKYNMPTAADAKPEAAPTIRLQRGP
jgi:hypothetical protein